MIPSIAFTLGIAKAIFTSFSVRHNSSVRILVRTCVDRLAGDGKGTIASEMKEVRVQGLHRIQVRDKKGNLSEAVLEIRYSRLLVHPPIGKQKNYPESDSYCNPRHRASALSRSYPPVLTRIYPSAR